MVRHELALPFLLLMAWVALRDRRIPWATLSLCFAFTAAWVLFRVIYYADIFPNTFHLKDDTHWSLGLAYVHNTLSAYWFYGFAGVALAAAMGLRISKSSGAGLQIADRLAILGLAASVTLYVIKIGGDFRHYRYLTFPFCLAATAGGGLAEHFFASLALKDEAEEGRGGRRTVWLQRIAAVVMFAWMVAAIWMGLKGLYAYPLVLSMVFGTLGVLVFSIRRNPGGTLASAAVGLAGLAGGFSLGIVVGAMAGIAFVAFAAQRDWLPLETGLALGFACLSFSLYPAMASQHPIFPGGEARIVNNLLGRDYLIHNFNLKSYLVPETNRLAQYKTYRTTSAGQEAPPVGVINVNAIMYKRYDYRFIHSLGLTDGVLAHVNTEGLARPPSLRGLPSFVAHKWPLVPLAQDLWEIQSVITPGPGMYERAKDAGVAPQWVAANLDSLSLLEKKIYNEHSLIENLRLALTPVPAMEIEIGPATQSAVQSVGL